ncbi:MAG: sigma 54-interacting transcriptional regulator [Deltaproteobacteria bacterium]|nr:sigma 54-interacting transcriptional regulator [Deltaproteobacteria bacterium]
MSRKKTVVVGLLGPTLDLGTKTNRWERWRPTVSLCQHEDLLVDRLELLYQRRYTALAQTVTADIQSVSPETEVVHRLIEFEDAWDLEEVYGALLDFARSRVWAPDKEDYLVHITTGTHIAQISMFLLVEAHHIPARLIQTAPPVRSQGGTAGSFAIIDLDLSKYDTIAARFRREQKEGLSLLKAGIDTRNAAFNQLIERIEQVAIRSRDPLLLMGPTGAGKSQLARRIFELKKARRQVAGPLVEVNCATLRGDGAMSTLFGHVKGAFTGAIADRQGLLRKANGGILMLDEIGELGSDEQAMLLHAIEEKSFFPVGSDREVQSDFQLIAGTNRDLRRDVEQGRFREDLLARIDLWSFKLPGLRERPEDVAPNLEYELDRWAQSGGEAVTFSREARDRFLDFARGPGAAWAGNFRDFNAAVRRMATLASGGRVTREIVDEEIVRLRDAWRSGEVSSGGLVDEILGSRAAGVDPFDRVQLEEVLRACRSARSLSEAGRSLFAISRTRKASSNDADRLRKYLARYGLAWADVATRR